MARRRHLSRIAVMQTLFEMQVRKDADAPDERADERILAQNIAEFGEENVDREFANTLLSGTLEKWDDIVSRLTSAAPQWPMERMDPVSRATLMVGGFEILFANDAPPPVVMDEAIEIAKEYGTGESGKFVNGVLNALANANRRPSS